MAADGAGESECIDPETKGAPFPWAWADDGKILVAETGLASSLSDKTDIGIIHLEKDRKWIPLLHEEEYSEHQPQISPDGRWIAYSSDESGSFEVYLRSFPDVDVVRKKVSTNGGNSPLWSSDSKKLFYRNDKTILEVSIETEPDLILQEPKILFERDYVYTVGMVGATWDMHPDHERFLMLKPPPDESGAKITIVTNWFEELKERVPTD